MTCSSTKKENNLSPPQLPDETSPLPPARIGVRQAQKNSEQVNGAARQPNLKSRNNSPSVQAKNGPVNRQPHKCRCAIPAGSVYCIFSHPSIASASSMMKPGAFFLQLFFAPCAVRHLAQSLSRQKHCLIIAQKPKQHQNSPHHTASDTNPPGQDWRHSETQDQQKSNTGVSGAASQPSKKYPIK